ncbi:MAG: AraC family transcriptional regulator ligand-binding domain-containing protein [Ketobacteraceae bacterium]|nr:AraC family transcriptional regulator ligand-binding domain-containing protein [Ketobacteraceae bacterium]
MWAINNAMADLNRKIMPPSIALVLINAIEQEGINVDGLREKYQLTDRRLLDTSETLSPIEVQWFVLEALKNQSHVPVSFRFGKQLSVNLMGDLGQVMMSARTLAEALHDLSQYVRAFSYLIGYDIQESRDRFVLLPQLGAYASGPEYNLRFAMETALTSTLSILRFLAGIIIHPESVSFTFEKPRYVEKYQELFGENITFGARRNEVVYRQEDLAREVVTGNPVVHELFKKRCEEKLKAIDSRQTIETLAKNYLKASDRIPAFEELGFALGLTPSSLRRKLMSANTSYQQLVDEIRQERAERLLRNRRMSVEYIAMQLGFADASNFRRAFKRWTGETPSDYRRHYG